MAGEDPAPAEEEGEPEAADQADPALEQAEEEEMAAAAREAEARSRGRMTRGDRW